VREGRKRLPVDRQVQLIAGLMVLTGATLGAFVNAWFLVIAAFFGAGLTFAGATGTCGLALLLMKMPWNRASALPTDTSAAGCAAGGGQSAVCSAPTAPGNRKRPESPAIVKTEDGLPRRCFGPDCGPAAHI
jgi:hypothetical protein